MFDLTIKYIINMNNYDNARDINGIAAIKQHLTD